MRSLRTSLYAWRSNTKKCSCGNPFTKITLVILVAAVGCPSFAQQTSPSRATSAISFLTQAVTAAGGSATIAAIQDFTAEGSITHNWADNPEQGQLTIKSRGAGQFRLDSQVSEGTWSYILNNGAAQLTLPDGSIYPIAYHNALNSGALTWPTARLSAALLDPTVSVIDLGLVQIGNTQARGIRTIRSGPFAGFTQTDYFLDPTHFIVLRFQDQVHPDNDAINGATLRQLDFSNYQQVNGVLVPFSVAQSVAGQTVWTIQLTSVVFNSGLSDSDFQF